jgi:lipopolysaccharide export LptBFGC system permease protein LptF
MILAMSAVVLWDGSDENGINLAYLASLYLPPLLAAILSYFALRKKHLRTHA